jgi:hypothetical protein
MAHRFLRRKELLALILKDRFPNLKHRALPLLKSLNVNGVLSLYYPTNRRSSLLLLNVP